VSSGKRSRFLGAGFVALPAAAACMIAPSGAFAAEPQVDWAPFGLVWVGPFVGLLLSIAVLPLIVPRFWHHNFGKVAAFWALAFLVPFALEVGPEMALFEVVHTALLEYLPFIILLFALYTVSGGVRLKGSLAGSPVVNTGLLAIGTGAASVMGTTGAAMLLVRPLLQANRGRQHNVHVVVFFIFLVANIGGSLTPLGDPPLFLGFLKGVDFFWPTRHMLAPMALVSGCLLALFFVLDTVLYQREERPPLPKEEGLAIEGIPNLLLLGCIVGTVLMSGVWRPGVVFEVYRVPLALQDLARDVLLVAIALLSLRLVSAERRQANEFSWFPMLEVAKLFAGIFVTIIPALGVLRAGESGSLAFVVDALSRDGAPVDHLYFWITGAVSSFLDNAPTYLVFFNTAGGDAEVLMGPLRSTLLAISAGAVFMGAMTYIGNAPNFMVRAIAVERGVAMPSFFGYMLWSCGILIPIFALVTIVFF
jgi:Na+/H+ antiporter NhaD/arsenite permease-like protein